VSAISINISVINVNRYPAMPKHVYSARLLSDKMLVYANSLRDEIEDLITPLLVFGQTKDINNTSYFCNPNSPSSDWVDYPGGIRQQSIFSFVSKSMSGLGQDCAVANKYRRQKMVPLSASLYEKNPSSSNTDPPLADTSTSLRYEEGTDMDAVDGKSIRGRRRWSVGLGEKEIIDNVGGTPVAGIPPVLPEESIPVHSAIQWGRCFVQIELITYFAWYWLDVYCSYSSSTLYSSFFSFNYTVQRSTNRVISSSF
jgi:hypothetical protein